MTTRPRSVPFQPLDVSRTQRDSASRSVDGAPKLRFSDLLKARRSPAAPTSPDAEKQSPTASLDGHVHPGEDAFDEPAESDDSATAESDSLEPEPLPEPPAKDTAGSGMSEEWLDSLVPTSEHLEEMMVGGRRVARAQAVEAAKVAHPSIAAIAKTISHFCNDPAVAESEGWQVRMPMNPDVLPDTVLQLSVSPYWLQLRFETTDVGSRDLLFAHRDALQLLLEDSVSRRRDISIVIE